MWRRRGVILLLGGILCLQVSLLANDPSNLLKKGRDAFRSGKLDDAERYSRQALDEAERTGNSVQKGEALGDLGAVLLARGRHAEAKSACLQALEVLRNSSSKRYLPVVLNNLGALSSENEEFVQAESYLTESLRIIKELNPGDPYRARVLNNLGALHYATKNMKHAEKDFRQAIDVLEKEYGANSSELVPLLNNLGGVYVAEKKWDAANALFSKALTLLKDSTGPTLASVFDSIGTMHFARRRYTEAQEAFRKSYQIRLEAFGKGHPAVASSAANLASALSATGRYTDAGDLLNDALQVYEKTFGSQSAQVLETLEKLTDVYRKAGKEKEAVLTEERAEDIRFDRERVVRVDVLR